MANYFYVKSGGSANTGTATATTAPGTKRTGAWSGDSLGYFASVEIAMDGDDTVAPVGGDFICVSDASNYSTGSTITCVPQSTGTSKPVQIISVDDSNQEIAKKATTKQEDTAGEYRICAVTDGFASLWGMHIECNSGFLAGSAYTSYRLNNCQIDLMAAGGGIGSGNTTGISTDLVNTNVYCANTGTTVIYVTRGSRLKWVGGAVTAATTIANLTHTSTGFIGGGFVHLIGVDLSVVTAYLLAGVGSTAGQDGTFQLRLEGCKLRATPPAWIEQTLIAPDISVFATNCSGTSADAEWQYYYEDLYGSVEAVDTGSIWRQDTDSSRVFPSGETISYKVATSAYTSEICPLVFDLPARFMELSGASTDKIRIYFVIATGTLLYNTDIWADVTYPDGTTKNEWLFLSNQNTDPLLEIGGGTVHQTDGVSDWRNAGAALTGYNEYYMDIDTAASGSDSVPTIRLSAAIPSKTIYVAMHIDTVA